jgi:hypothetical protein
MKASAKRVHNGEKLDLSTATQYFDNSHNNVYRAEAVLCVVIFFLYSLLV